MNVLKIVLLSFLATAIMLVSCAKNDASELDPSNSPIGSLSSVAVFNVIPRSTGLTLAIGQGNSEKTAIAASDKLVFGSYVVYKNWFAGDFNLSIQNLSGLTRESIQKRVFLSPGKFFSLFLYRSKDKIETILSDDNIISPAEGKVKLRVVHLNEDLSEVNVSLNNTTLFRGIKYENVSNYIEIESQGTRNITVETSDGKFMVEFKDNEGFVNKGLYTILLKKLANESERSSAEDYISIIKQ